MKKKLSAATKRELLLARGRVKRKLLSVLAYGSFLSVVFSLILELRYDNNGWLNISNPERIVISSLASIVIPIAIFFGSRDRAVKKNAKEALNFLISFFVYELISLLLVVVVIGFLLLPILVILQAILPIFAIVHVLRYPNKPYRYPFIFRLLRSGYR